MGARNLCDLLRGLQRLAGTEADIRIMLAELHGEGGVLNFQDTHRNPQDGQEYPVFLLPKRETLILISGYSVQMRARIIPMAGDGLTMSSREIAELTGSTHDNVLKTVRRLISEGVVLGNETPYIHPQNGQTYMEFRMSFRDTMVVVSGYSAELRARIIDRWRRSFRVREGRVSRVPKRAIGEMYARAEQAEAHPEFSEALKGKIEVAGAVSSLCNCTAANPADAAHAWAKQYEARQLADKQSPIRLKP